MRQKKKFINELCKQFMIFTIYKRKINPYNKEGKSEIGKIVKILSLLVIQLNFVYVKLESLTAIAFLC